MGLDSRQSDQSGQWTPTFTDVTGLNGAVVNGAMYTVVGNVVSCWINVSLETDAGTVEFTITLPPDFSRIFSGVGDAAGVVNASVVGVGAIEATDGAATVTGTVQQGADTIVNAIAFAYVLD